MTTPRPGAPVETCRNCNVSGGHKPWCPVVPLEARVLPLVPAADAGRPARPRAARRLVAVGNERLASQGWRS